MRGRFGIVGFLFIVVLALLIGGVAYNLGLNAGQVQVAAPGTVVYPVGYAHWGFGFGLLGLLFPLLIIGLLIAAFRPRRWAGGPGRWSGMGPGGPGGGPGGWGHGGWGHGGWAGQVDPNDPQVRDWMQRGVPPAFQPMLEQWHRQAHGEAPVGGPTAGSPAGGGTASGATGAGSPPTADPASSSGA